MQKQSQRWSRPLLGRFIIVELFPSFRFKITFDSLHAPIHVQLLARENIIIRVTNQDSPCEEFNLMNTDFINLQ